MIIIVECVHIISTKRCSHDIIFQNCNIYIPHKCSLHVCGQKQNKKDFLNL